MLTSVNLFGLFVRLTHPAKRFGWKETMAYFTGDARIPHRARGGHYPLMTITSPVEAKEYAIRYYVDDQVRTGWYLFYPGPDPDPEDIKGMTLKIRYKKSRPWIFENISGMEEE